MGERVDVFRPAGNAGVANRVKDEWFDAGKFERGSALLLQRRPVYVAALRRPREYPLRGENSFAHLQNTLNALTGKNHPSRSSAVALVDHDYGHHESFPT